MASAAATTYISTSGSRFRAVLVSMAVAWTASVAGGQTSTPTMTPTPTRTPTATSVPTLPGGPCYAVPDSTDQLVTIDPLSGVQTVIGATGAPGTIYGLAVAPVGSTLYAATQSQLGTLNTGSGAFTAIGSFGTASGLYGSVALDQVVDLSIDPGNGRLFGVHRMSFPSDRCYAVADSNDRLVTIDKTSGSEAEAIVGTTTSGVQAIAIIGSTIYGASGNQLGVINRSTAAFSARSSIFGTTVNPTMETVDDIRGLAYDPINDVLYASHRVAGADDLLFAVNRDTGALVLAQFTAGTEDYVEISGICDVDTDVEALAFDPVNEVLYASIGDELVEIDVVDGDCNDVGDFGGGGPAITITGLGFDANGDLFGTSANGFYSIDVGTGAATLAAPALTAGTNYGAFDCSFPLPDVLFRIDPYTGSHVPFAMFFGTASYAPIENAGDCGTTTEALAVDREFDIMYGVDTLGQQLISVDQDTAVCTDPFVATDTDYDDVLDISYAANGVLYGTGANTLYSIETITGSATALWPLSAVGYQAFDCPRSGCSLFVRKQHSGVPYLNENITYKLSWSSPCDGFIFNNVTITDALPSGVQLISASSPDATTSVVGNTVTFVDSFLEKAPARTASIIAKVTGLPGDQITNQVTLQDEYGRSYFAQDKFRVREERSRLSLDLHGQSKSQVGKSITYTARYRNFVGTGTLTLTLPSGVTVVTVSPLPTSNVNNVLTWVGPGGPSGSVRVRVKVNEGVTASSLTATALLTGSPGTLQDSHITSLRVVPTRTPTPSPTPVPDGGLTLNAVRRVLAGTETQITVQYAGTTAPSTVTVTLPAQMAITQTLPSATVAGGAATWTGLASPSGSMRLKALVAAGTPAGTLLNVSATISGSSSGIVATQIEVRSE